MTNKKQLIKKRCARYLVEEADENLRAQIHDLITNDTAGDEQELFDRMGQNLRFGTAGLRGKMEAGYNRLNLVSVFRFSYALGMYLATVTKPLVVIGRDARDLSPEFAHEVANTLSAMGIKVFLLDKEIPTPILAFATKNLSATIGVMITASHNPKCDNGIKLFDRSSSQISGGLLKEIENNMDLAPHRSKFIASHQGKSLRTFVLLDVDEIFSKYLQDIGKTKLFCDGEIDKEVKIVYTPLHGVGKKYFLKALAEEGFTNVDVVVEQGEPNGSFSTVKFPNPEEEHTLDLAHDTAKKLHCDWVFANDPDADRLQVSYIDGSNNFRKLSGNEIGAILGYFSILSAKKRGVKPLLASTIVSSRMLKYMCQNMDADYVDSLTGFANVTKAALKAQAISKSKYVFGYEEAIGFLIGQVVLDKDGINAGARFMEVVGYLNRCQKTVWQLLDELYLRFGIFVAKQWSVRFDGITASDDMARLMSRIDRASSEQLADVFGLTKCSKIDLNQKQKTALYDDLKSNVIIFENSNFRLLTRPSGTEPKIKFYLELSDRATDGQELSNKRKMLEKRYDEIQAALAEFLDL